MNKVYIIDEDGKQYELGELKELTEADIQDEIDEAELDMCQDILFEGELATDYVAAFRMKVALMGKDYWKGKVPQVIFAKCH